MSAPAPVEDRFDAVQAALQCPFCAGQRRFSPETGRLVCESCGKDSEIEDDGALEARREQAYDPNDLDGEIPEVDRAHRCESCGGEVVFVGRAVSERCPYCNGPIVLHGGHARFMPSGLIPFAVAQTQAEANIRHWLRSRWAAPGDLRGAVSDGRVAGVYAPFWTFDASHAINYWAKKRVGFDDDAKWVDVTGATTLAVDDAVIAASDHVTPAIRDGIMHGFSPDKLRSYLPAYLAGFAGELHQGRVSEGLERYRRDIEVKVHRRIRRDIGTPRVSDIRYLAELSGIRFRRILLPLWIWHFTYRGEPMRIVVSGIDGKTFGQRPYSRQKLLAYSLGVVVPAFLLGAKIGAVLAPAGF